jgi:hypothetical protein
MIASQLWDFLHIRMTVGDRKSRFTLAHRKQTVALKLLSVFPSLGGLALGYTSEPEQPLLAQRYSAA